MRRFLFVCALASSFSFVLPARADLPVIDFSAIAEAIEEVRNQIQELIDDNEFLADWIEQLQKMDDEITKMTDEIRKTEEVVTSLTDIPGDLITQVSELLDLALQNPLQDIKSNLRNIMFHSGGGSCAGSSDILSMSKFHTAVGGDLNSGWINGTASRLSGVLACTERLITSTQDHLNALPHLLKQLGDCKDTACTTGVTARVEVEVANINALHEQGALMAQEAQTYQLIHEAQHEQKQRKDAEEGATATAGWDLSGGDQTSTVMDAPTFTAANNGD